MGHGERVIGLGRAGGKGGEKWPGPVRVWAGEKGREGGRVGPLEEKKETGLCWAAGLDSLLLFLPLFPISISNSNSSQMNSNLNLNSLKHSNK